MSAPAQSSDLQLRAAERSLREGINKGVKPPRDPTGNEILDALPMDPAGGAATSTHLLPAKAAIGSESFRAEASALC